MPMSESLKPQLAACRKLRELGKYTEAVSSLQTLISSNPGDLLARGELGETLAAQGYTKQAYDAVIEGLKWAKSPETDPNVFAYLEIQWCFYGCYVTCSFDVALACAAEVYRGTLKDLDLSVIDQYMVFTMSCYCRLLCIAQLMHKQLPSDLAALAEDKLKPMFHSLLERGMYREALRWAMDYRRCISTPNKCILLTILVVHPLVPPLVRADALMDTVDVLKLSGDLSGYQDALRQAKEIYETEGHAHGVLDISVRESCGQIAVNASRKDDGSTGSTNFKPIEKAEDLPFDGYLAQYEAMNYLAGEQAALDQIFNVVEEFPFSSMDNQITILQKGREITMKGGSKLINILRDIQIVTRWLSLAGHGAKIIENATELWNDLQSSDCYYLRGLIAQVLSSTYIWVADQKAAEKWGQECQDAWEHCFDIDKSQGRTVVLRAKFLKRGIYTAVDREALISSAREHATWDIENKFYVQAAQKLEILVLELVAASRTAKEELAVKEMMAQVEDLVEKLTDSETVEKLVNLYQARISILLRDAGTRRDIVLEEEGLQLTTKAVAMSLKAKKIFEAANTLQIAALLVFNIFRKKPEPDILQNCYDRFVVSRDAFKELGILYYQCESAYWLALVLYEGWCRRWASKETVLTALLEAERLFDQQRSEISILKGLQAIEAKQKIVSQDHVRALYRFAIQICIGEEMNESLWEWVQKAKARSLSDLLGLGVLVPEALRLRIEDDAVTRDLFQRELKLMESIQNAKAKDRLGLRYDLDALHRQMENSPVFEELFALREGRPVALKEMYHILNDMEKAHPNLNLVLADWFTDNEEIYLCIIQGRQASPVVKVVRTFHYMSEVKRWKAQYLDTEEGREEALESDNNEDSPFRELDFLVQPLSELSKNEDLLVLSVTGSMHSIPIHALWIRNDTPIIETNPLTYCANLTTFTQCIHRARTRTTQDSQTTLIAIYEPTPNLPFNTTEQLAVYNSISTLPSITSLTNALTLTGPSITHSAFQTALEQSSLIHFHGHCLFDSTSITDQSLILSSSNFSIKHLFDLNLKSPHVTLIACDSASQSVEKGDEPLGMVTGFLCAGASSVIGTLWPIGSGCGRAFSRAFYEEAGSLDGCKEGQGKGNGERWLDLVRAWREAVLEIKGNVRTRTPYFWASFVVHGAWFYKIGQREGLKK